MADRLVIGMSGASGAPLTLELLKQLKEGHPEIETHLVISHSAELTLAQETGLCPDDLRSMVACLHDNYAIGDSIASGSFRTMGMIIIPCSMKTAAGIISGYSDNLLLRAADVCLKERRRLVLVARETPLSTIHLRNLYELSRLGAVIAPPVPAYYRHPASMEDCIRHTVQRLLEFFLPDGAAYQWHGMPSGNI